MGEKIPVLRLLPYKLCLFAIHQISMQKVGSSFTVCTADVYTKQQEEWTETGYQRPAQRHAEDLLCNPVLCHAVKHSRNSCYLLLGETAKVLCLLETQAHVQVAFNATTDVLEIGKKYVPIHRVNGGSAAY